MTRVSNPLLASMSPDELLQTMAYLGCRTQSQLAEKIGITRSCVYLWLKGKVGVPRHVAMLLRMMAAEAKLSGFAGVPLDLVELIEREADKHGVTLVQLRRPSRDRRLVGVRKNAAEIARREGFSFTQIGRALNRDHSTIMHTLRDAS